jgi:hypothetical protein
MAQSYLGPDVMIIAAMLYDRATRGHIHKIYFLAIPWVIAVQSISSAVYHWAGWMPLARWMIGY